MNKISENYYEFTIKELKESLAEGGEIVVPLYQRGIKWKKSQRENLINTLMKNYPFGCILLNRYDGNKYRIIDGLQRSYALIDFYDNPMPYYTEKYISENEIEKIAKLVRREEIKDEIRSSLPTKIVSYVEKTGCDTLNKFKKIDVSQLVLDIVNTWPGLVNKTKEITAIIKDINKMFINSYEKIVNDLKIPAQVFEAEEESLPDIFERINTEGSKLTRFQVYAATWSDDKVIITSPKLHKIIENVRQRYEKYLQDVGKLEGFNSEAFGKKKEVNIFDLLYGFGRMISIEYPTLFNSKSEDSWGENDIPSIGFNLINACLLQKSSNMDKLNKNIEVLVGFDSQSICAFLENIIECVDYVDKKLARATRFKGNKNSDSNPSPIHSELQIVSIIATMFVLKYVKCEKNEENEPTRIIVNKTPVSTWSSYFKKQFDDNVLITYANDLIGERWKGSGDSKLYNALLKGKYCRSEIKWDEFQMTLDKYFEDQKREREERTKVANPNNVDKLIINLIYSSILTAGDQIDDSGFDIEHLATKGIMKARIKYYNENEKGAENLGLPISSIGNICLLPKDYNELKGEKLMYQFTHALDKDKKKIVFPIESYEKKFTFTKESDFEWLEGKNDYTFEEFSAKYHEYLSKRFKIMKEKIKNKYF